MKYKYIFLFFGLVAVIIILNGCKSNSTSPQDTSNHMVLVSSYHTSGYSEGIYVYNIANIPYAFVADGTNGLQIINVNNRTNPILTSHFQTAGTAFDVMVAPINSINYAFVSDGNQGLDIINMTNPNTPVLDTTLLIPNDRVLTSFVDATNKVAYVGTYYGKIYIYSLSNLPSHIDSLTVAYRYDHVLSIQVLDNIAYVAEASAGLEIFNVINPATPTFIGGFQAQDIAYDLKVYGHYVYLAYGLNGMMIIDVTNPFQPAFINSIKTSGATYVGLAYNSNLVYTASADFGVETFSVATPNSLLEIGNYKTNSYAQRVFYYNGYIYTAASAQGLQILQYQP